MEKFAIGLLLGGCAGALLTANNYKIRTCVKKGQEEMQEKFDKMLDDTIRKMDKGEKPVAEKMEKVAEKTADTMEKTAEKIEKTAKKIRPTKKEKAAKAQA